MVRRNLAGVRYFADENTLGMARVLERRGRSDLVFPGHPDLPDVERGTPDLEWIPIVARFDLIVLTRERHLRTRPAEAQALRSHGLRVVRLGAKQDLNPDALASLFEGCEDRIDRLAIKLGPGPWFLRARPTGVSKATDRLS